MLLPSSDLSFHCSHAREMVRSGRPRKLSVQTICSAAMKVPGGPQQHCWDNNVDWVNISSQDWKLAKSWKLKIVV